MFLSVSKRFQDSRNDETIGIPAVLDGLTIVSCYDRRSRLLVHFITNLSVLAEFMIEDNVNRGEGVSKEAYLLKCLFSCGLIEVVQSATFGVTNNAEKNRILTDRQSTFALAHPNVPVLDRSTILGIPGANGHKNNKEYREANTPAWYIGNSEVKHVSKRQVMKIVGGRKEDLFQFLEELMQRFKNQVSNEPVEETSPLVGRGRNKTSHLVIYGFYNPHA